MEAAPTDPEPEPEPAAPDPAHIPEAPAPASRFPEDRAQITAQGCLGALLQVEGVDEPVPLSHSAVELNSDLIRITVDPGQHPNWRGPAAVTLECEDPGAAAKWKQDIAAKNEEEDLKVWGVSGHFLRSEKDRFEALVAAGGNVFALMEGIGIIPRLKANCEGRSWNNDWSKEEARMEATPVEDLMLFDLMEIYKFAGDK